MTQGKIILKLLRENPDRWFKGYELVKVSTPYGWLGSSADRCARKLSELGSILKRHQGKYVEFKAKEPKGYTEYKVNGEVVVKEIIWQ